MLSLVWGLGWVVTSIERTAHPRFKRLITAHELEWATDATDCDEHLLALLLMLMLMLKSYRRMGSFPALEDVPEMVVDFVRRAVERAVDHGAVIRPPAARPAGLRQQRSCPFPLRFSQ
jgi:hypothetical protein